MGDVEVWHNFTNQSRSAFGGDSTMPALHGRNILVTGGSRGIGAAIVEAIAGEGARPIIHYGRDKQSAEKLLDRIGGVGWITQADFWIQRSHPLYLSKPCIWRGVSTAL